MYSIAPMGFTMITMAAPYSNRISVEGFSALAGHNLPKQNSKSDLFPDLRLPYLDKRVRQL